MFTTFEGDNHVLLQLVAKGLLTDYASDFEDLDQFGMVRFVAGMAVETVSRDQRAQAARADPRRRCPAATTWDQDAGLLDPDYHLDDAALARGAHARRRRPAAQARHRRRDEPGRGVLPRARTT